jgi:hypothetical protein
VREVKLAGCGRADCGVVIENREEASRKKQEARRILLKNKILKQKGKRRLVGFEYVE